MNPETVVDREPDDQITRIEDSPLAYGEYEAFTRRKL